MPDGAESKSRILRNAATVRTANAATQQPGRVLSGQRRRATATPERGGQHHPRQMPARSGRRRTSPGFSEYAVEEQRHEQRPGQKQVGVRPGAPPEAPAQHAQAHNQQRQHAQAVHESQVRRSASATSSGRHRVGRIHPHEGGDLLGVVEKVGARAGRWRRFAQAGEEVRRSMAASGVRRRRRARRRRRV